MSGGPISLAVAKARPQNIKIMLKSAEHDMKLLRNTDVTKIKGKFRFIHHINWSFIKYTNEMSTIALNNTLMSRIKNGSRILVPGPGRWSRLLFLPIE